MSEEVKELNDGTFSGLKKTIIGTLGTLVTAGGVWVSTTLFNGGEEKEETKTEQSGGQSAPITINVQQNQENKQKSENNNGGGVVRERIIERPAPATQQPAPQPKKEEDSW